MTTFRQRLQPAFWGTNNLHKWTRVRFLFLLNSRKTFFFEIKLNLVNTTTTPNLFKWATKWKKNGFGKLAAKKKLPKRHDFKFFESLVFQFNNFHCIHWIVFFFAFWLHFNLNVTEFCISNLLQHHKATRTRD